MSPGATSRTRLQRSARSRSLPGDHHSSSTIAVTSPRGVMANQRPRVVPKDELLDRSDDSGPAAGPVVGYLITPNAVHRVCAGENMVGRDSDCSIVIDASGVSRQHARIMADAAEAVVEDLGSKNGTRVNGARVDARVMLADGDELRVGVIVMIYRTQASRKSTTLLDPPGGTSGEA